MRTGFIPLYYTPIRGAGVNDVLLSVPLELLEPLFSLMSPVGDTVQLSPLCVQGWVGECRMASSTVGCTTASTRLLLLGFALFSHCNLGGFVVLVLCSQVWPEWNLNDGYDFDMVKCWRIQDYSNITFFRFVFPLLSSLSPFWGVGESMKCCYLYFTPKLKFLWNMLSKIWLISFPFKWKSD